MADTELLVIDTKARGCVQRRSCWSCLEECGVANQETRRLYQQQILMMAVQLKGRARETPRSLTLLCYLALPSSALIWCSHYSP